MPENVACKTVPIVYSDFMIDWHGDIMLKALG